MVQNQDANKLFEEGLKEFAKSNYWTAVECFAEAATKGHEQAKITELATELLYCAGNE
jgi:outer membrane protein assembly factor BamD (BamD/ComL family)